MALSAQVHANAHAHDAHRQFTCEEMGSEGWRRASRSNVPAGRAAAASEAMLVAGRAAASLSTRARGALASATPTTQACVACSTDFFSYSFITASGKPRAYSRRWTIPGLLRSFLSRMSSCFSRSLRAEGLNSSPASTCRKSGINVGLCVVVEGGIDASFMSA